MLSSSQRDTNGKGVNRLNALESLVNEKMNNYENFLKQTLKDKNVLEKPVRYQDQDVILTPCTLKKAQALIQRDGLAKESTNETQNRKVSIIPS